MTKSQRIGVWIDYENARRRAAACFRADVVDTEGFGFRNLPGHFWPLALSRQLVARTVAVAPRAGRGGQAGPWRELVRVDAFLGMPDARQRPTLAYYVERMTQAWSRQGVNITLLPTRLTESGAEVEKGIDVSLAMSVQEAAIRREVDVVILVSADNDLLPVVYELHPQRSYLPGVELAAWRGPKGGTTMRAPVGVLTHLLGSADYAEVASDLVRDFGRPAGAAPDEAVGSTREVAGQRVTTLADRFAAAGIAVRVGPLRPIDAGHVKDAALWHPEPVMVRRIHFGSAGIVPGETRQPTVIVVPSSSPVAASLPAPVSEESQPVHPPRARRAWWRRVWAAVVGHLRRPRRSDQAPRPPDDPTATLDKCDASTSTVVVMAAR
jgi:hypothetical protein